MCRDVLASSSRPAGVLLVSVVLWVTRVCLLGLQRELESEQDAPGQPGGQQEVVGPRCPSWSERNVPVDAGFMDRRTSHPLATS